MSPQLCHVLMGIYGRHEKRSLKQVSKRSKWKHSQRVKSFSSEPSPQWSMPSQTFQLLIHFMLLQRKLVSESQVTFWQTWVVSSESSPQSLAPSQRKLMLMHTCNKNLHAITFLQKVKLYVRTHDELSSSKQKTKLNIITNICFNNEPVSYINKTNNWISSLR